MSGGAADLRQAHHLLRKRIVALVVPAGEEAGPEGLDGPLQPVLCQAMCYATEGANHAAGRRMSAGSVKDA